MTGEGRAPLQAPHAYPFRPNSLRSSPRRHLGDRTTTMPIKTPPLCQNVLQYMAAGAEG